MPPKSKKSQNQELLAGQSQQDILLPFEKKAKPLPKQGRKKKDPVSINDNNEVEIQKSATVPAKRGRKKKDSVTINDDVNNVNEEPLMVPAKQGQKNSDIDGEPVINNDTDVEDGDEGPETALAKPLVQRPTIPLTDSINKLLEMSDDDFSEGNFLC